jgi:hypothetical protein
VNLTAAQSRELQQALRQHPALYLPARKGVATRIAGLGLFEISGEGFRLTKEGLDLAARLGAQRIIDRVNDARAPAAAAPPRPTPLDGPGVPPTNWPFPCSAHAW